MDYFTDWFTGRQRPKKEGNVVHLKECSPPPSVEPNNVGSSIDCLSSNRSSNSFSSLNSSSTTNSNLIYLQPEFAILTRSLSESNIHELIRQPMGVDRNEWIANNIVAFYNHVNSLHNALAEFCTINSCPEMIGPQKSFYHWIDERNKKFKCSAPQYIDLSLVFIQKSLDDETLFPSRLDHQFPVYFDSLVKKLVRLLYHVVAHFYAAHYHQIVDLGLHPHLNSFFLHFVSFLISSKIISSDNSTVNTSSTGSTTNSSPFIPGSTDGRELRTDLESLDVLYRTLSEHWRHSFGQISSHKRKANKSE